MRPGKAFKYIGERITLSRERRNLAVLDAAEKLGISPGDLMGMENGTKGMTASDICAIAAAFGVSAYYIITGIEEKTIGMQIAIAEVAISRAERQNALAK
ncbi:MAG: helix-turn-helix domain-containing protein [Rickettsiales bacterium]|jgi:transcriptional regulator with XRE-family HTH domain|nr:helix-turn-helix domain-containing protein [Rickettsiales bacterium]